MQSPARCCPRHLPGVHCTGFVQRGTKSTHGTLRELGESSSLEFGDPCRMFIFQVIGPRPPRGQTVVRQKGGLLAHPAPPP